MDRDLDIVRPKHSKTDKHQKDNLVYKIVLSLIAFIVVVGLGFLGGVSYQKHHSYATATTADANRASSGRGGFGSFRNGNRTIGQVTAISATSITVQPSFGGSTAKTYSISSSTTVTDQGQSSSLSAIAVGDTVFVSASTSDTNQATSISINPSFGGFGGGNGSQTNSSEQLN